MMGKKKKIVFLTGAGMSRESGLPVFRGEGGIWNELDVEKVATRKSWYSGRRSNCAEIRQAMLDFFNPMRRLVIEKAPNEGHRLMAALETDYEVTIVTQNGDDFHERAGSTHVIHLHGEALKNASTLHPYESFPIDRNHPDIHLGDKAPDGSQIRPYVIFFDEDIEVPLWKASVEAVKAADLVVVVGSTMLVFPAADLLSLVPPERDIYVIDPAELTFPESLKVSFRHIRAGASAGMRELIEMLKSNVL